MPSSQRRPRIHESGAKCAGRIHHSLFPEPSAYNTSLSSSLCQGARRDNRLSLLRATTGIMGTADGTKPRGWSLPVQPSAGAGSAEVRAVCVPLRFLRPGKMEPVSVSHQEPQRRAEDAHLCATRCPSAYFPVAAPTFSNSSPVAASTSACSEFPCESIVTMAGKPFASKTHIASGTPSSSSR